MPQRRALSGSSADFFDRSVHEVARDLIGCRLLFDGSGGTIVETESYERDDPACHAYVGLTERTSPLRAARPRLRLPLLRHPQPAQLRRRTGGRCRRGPDPRAGADRRAWSRCATAAGPPRHGLCSGPGKLTEALGVSLAENDADLAPRPVPPPAAGGRAPPEVVTGPANRHHQSRRAPLALQRRATASSRTLAAG